MHIKNVIVEGFKTYKERTVIGPFHEGHNIVVGKNGSGKSNIFDAILFVLTDKYSSLSSEDRQTLLHEGSGREIMSASVEIIFENTDQRFPIDQADVSIKRTIGLKKDEFFLNNKHVTKTEIVNLLESAGLSSSNPYYIVRQGKVNTLIKMKDSERLELLKEIAGTRAYDDKRKESLKIMEDSDSRRGIIDDVINYIEQRLKDLGEEKNELNEWQKCDADRRALEYTLYDREQREASEKIEEIDAQRTEAFERNKNFHDDVSKETESLRNAEEKLRNTKYELEDLKSQHDQLHIEKNELIQKKIKLELSYKDVEEKRKLNLADKDVARLELGQINKQIKSTEQKLAKCEKFFKERESQEEEVKKNLSSAEQRVAEIQAKQGRGNQFKSKKERDAYLKKEINKMEKEKKNIEKELRALKTSSEEYEAEEKRYVEKIEVAQTESTNLKAKIDSVAKNIQLGIEKRDEANNERKNLWKVESELQKKFNECRSVVDKAEGKLQFRMDKNLYRGLKSVKRICEENGIKGCHGPLIELFDCDDKFLKCVETTAGNSLFHVVVDNADIAMQIVKILNSERSGRVTFIPLENIHSKQYSYPKSLEAIPMIERLKFKPEFWKAMNQVFGKTLVVRSLEIGSQLSRMHDFNTITLDGDQVNKKGVFTGGFVDDKVSRIKIYRELEESRIQYNKLMEELENAKSTFLEKDQLVTKVMGEIQKLGAEKMHLRNTQQQQLKDLQVLLKDRAHITTNCSQIEKQCRSLEANITTVDERIFSLKSEINSSFGSKLNEEEHEELNTNITLITDLKKKLLEVSNSRATAEAEKNTLESLLEANLYKRREELNLMLEAEEQEEINDEYVAEGHDLQILSDRLEELDIRVNGVESDVDMKTNILRKLQGEIESLKAKGVVAEKMATKETKVIEKLMSKRSNLVRKKEDCLTKIRELGSLPADYEKYKSKNKKQLMNLLHEVNDLLKSYTHVNKKAIDQYMSFSNQRENLVSRKEQLLKGRESILGLIEHLDLKKDEAIQRTFKGIAKHFSTVFSELVPGGKGTLVIHTKKNEEENEENELEEKEQKVETTTEHYAGIGLKVNFPGQPHGTKQLSGGQQTVVALSLLFAIQRCDPSPFYFFDEIDSNLDSVHRASVAELIKRQSSDTQFITTTFRPELLTHAQKFFMISFRNKVSKVKEVDFEEATRVIHLVEKELHRKE